MHSSEGGRASPAHFLRSIESGQTAGQSCTWHLWPCLCAVFRCLCAVFNGTRLAAQTCSISLKPQAGGVTSLSLFHPICGSSHERPHLAVVGEGIQRQWLLPLVNEIDGLIQALHSHQRQDGTKDLLLYHGLCLLHVYQHCGSCGERKRQPCSLSWQEWEHSSRLGRLRI